MALEFPASPLSCSSHAKVNKSLRDRDLRFFFISLSLPVYNSKVSIKMMIPLAQDLAGQTSASEEKS